jgi:hypothetical protein
LVAYILLGQYSDCMGCTYESIIAVKPLEQDCLDIAEGIDKDRDGWDDLIIQKWTELGCENEYVV